MNRKPGIHILLVSFCILCSVAGMALAARPCWHIGRRTWLQWQARDLWRETLLTAGGRGAEPVTGAPLAWLGSDSGNLDSLVLYDASRSNLDRFPCLSRRGDLPGQRGLAIIQGHRDGHFRRLGRLNPAERVWLETRSGSLGFRIDRTEIIDAGELENALSARDYGESGLVLVTCYPFVFAGAAPQRFLVWLKPIGPHNLGERDKKATRKPYQNTNPHLDRNSRPVETSAIAPQQPMRMRLFSRLANR